MNGSESLRDMGRDTRAGVSRLVLLGPPGAGKGTQAARLADRLGVPHIATGSILREAVDLGTPLGRDVRPLLDAGDLVPDDLIVKTVLERIRQPDAAEGFILDGFPRTLGQAEALDSALSDLGRPLQRVIQLRVPEDEVAGRIAGRGEVAHRSDDREDIVADRLRVYDTETAPLAEYYRSRGVLVPVDGVGPIDEVARRIWDALA